MDRHDTRPARGADRVRLHGRGPLAGLAHRAALLRPAAAARAARCSPAATRRRSPRPRRTLGWAATETDWRRVVERDDDRPGRHLHARATRTPRSRSPRSRQASTCCARSRWPTRSPRPRRWPRRRPARRRAASARWSGFTYRRVPAIGLRPAAGRRGPAGRDPARAARSTCRTGSPTRPPPMSWRLEKDKAGSGALGDIGAHVVDLAQYITGQRLTGVSGMLETFVDRAPAGRRDGRVAVRDRGGTGTRPGDRRRRRAVPRPLLRRRAGELRGHPVRPGPQERHPHRDQRLAAAAWRSTSRT